MEALGRQEHGFADSVNEAHRPYQEAADRERTRCGPSFVQVSDLVIGQEIAPAGCEAAHGYQKQLDEVRGEMAKVFQVAVEKGMGHLGIIERHYEHYVGKPVPTAS